MRIIAGYARGVRLKSPPSTVKPTMDRVREAIFSKLGDIDGYTVVDFFAGSGALGLEAFSRGAERVAWIEKERRHSKVIEENLEIVKGSIPEPGQATVYTTDVLMGARLLSDWECDIIFADPPYNPNKKQKGSFELLTDPTFHEWAGDAQLVMEQSKHNPLDQECLKLWEIDWFRQYGNNNVYFLSAK